MKLKFTQFNFINSKEGPWDETEEWDAIMEESETFFESKFRLIRSYSIVRSTWLDRKNSGWFDCIFSVHGTFTHSFSNSGACSILKAIKEFQALSQKVIQQIKNTGATIENEKRLAIGARNAIEIEYEDRRCQEALFHQRLKQKKDELHRLNVEYQSLMQVLNSQESSDMNSIWE